eukprot:365584-Chlamydomonas_euryale.AAC.19
MVKRCQGNPCGCPVRLTRAVDPCGAVDPCARSSQPLCVQAGDGHGRAVVCRTHSSRASGGRRPCGRRRIGRRPRPARAGTPRYDQVPEQRGAAAVAAVNYNADLHVRLPVCHALVWLLFSKHLFFGGWLAGWDIPVLLYSLAGNSSLHLNQ